MDGEEIADTAGFRVVRPTRDEIIDRICSSHMNSLMVAVDEKMSKYSVPPEIDDKQETSSLQMQILKEAEVPHSLSEVFSTETLHAVILSCVCSYR